MDECDVYSRAAECSATCLGWVSRLLVALLVGHHCRNHQGLVVSC